MDSATKSILKGLTIGLGLIGVVAYVHYLSKKPKKKDTKNSNPKKILIVGDSQSAILTKDGNPISFTYPNILIKELKPKGYDIDVLALQGMSTKWMLENLPSKLKNKKYDRIYIYGGGNDSANSSIKIQSIVDNIQSMVDLSNDNGADAFVVLGYKIDGFADYKKMPITPYVKTKEAWIPLIERRKELQRELPNKIENASFVPVYDLGSRTSDGIHPNAEGHKIVAQNILKSILS
jgi:lysophospholipase L1-like esterase